MTAIALRDESDGLALLEQAKALLAEASDVEDVKTIRDKAEALRTYAKQQALGLDAQNYAAEVKLRAERRAGELLAADPALQNFRPIRSDTKSLLSEYGIERHESSRWQRIAALPEPTFERYIVEALDKRREITTAGALKLAKQTAAALHVESVPDVPSVPTGTFATIVADPPWRYGNTSTRAAAEDHYPTMSIEELCELDIARERAADQAHLYLWTTAGHLPHAFTVMAAWGFEYKTYLVWVKPQMGMGNYFRVSTELVLFGVKGGLRTQDMGLLNWFETSNVVDAKRGQHSAKPREFREHVKRASGGPYLEMFARCSKDSPQQTLDGSSPCQCSRCEDGWEVWGNQT
jgi:N6-adenosine-specific RNA methylase IME4